MLHYDLVIVGGGLAGAAFAIALRDSGLRIALIDAKLPSQNDTRLFALNYSSCQLLDHLDLWNQLQPYATPIEGVHVSHRKHFGSLRLLSSDVSLPYLGHVIPASYLETFLHNALLQLSNCHLYRPAKLLKMTQNNQLTQLEISDEEGLHYLEAPLVAAGDGSHSTVRSQIEELKTNTESFDYAQTAIVTKTLLKCTHKNIAYERFTADGAIAMLPLPNNECATIWTVDNKEANYLKSLDDSQFLQALQKEFGTRLGNLKKISHRYHSPLQMVKAKKNIYEGIFLIGNAAHTLHPIAAQGFNLALYEVAQLVDHIMEKISQNKVFTAKDLISVGDKINQQQALSIGVSHGLSQFFSTPFLSSFSCLGMIGLDLSPHLKTFFIKRMLGQNKFIPNLLLRKNL